MKSMVMSVSPALAEEWLKKNLRNRKKRPGAIAKYVRAMRNGEWKLTHQGVAFDTDGTLLDGQHRLEAVVISGVTVDMLVCFDLDREVYSYIDNGAVRNAADRLEKDKTHSEVINAACRIVYGYTASPAELIEMNERIGDTVGQLLDYCPSAATYFSCSSMKIAAVCHLLNGADEKYVLETYRALVLADIPRLSSTGNALVQQFLKGVLRAGDTRDTIARATMVFDPARKNNTKIVIKDPDVSYSWVRKILASHAQNLAENEELAA